MKPSLLNYYAQAAASAEYNLAIGQLPDRLSREVRELGTRMARQESRSKYLPPSGSLAARCAVAETFKLLGINSYADRCIIGNGAKALFLQALLAVRNRTPHLIWFTPGYPPYQRASALAGMTTSAVSCPEPDFSPDMTALEDELLSESGCAIALSNPVNPTGRVWGQDTLAAITALACRHNAIVISDETYGDFSFDEPAVPLATLPGMSDRTVTIRSGSKELRAPGFRLGYATGPKAIIDSMAAIAGDGFGCPNSVADCMAILLPGRSKSVASVVRRLRSNRQTVSLWAADNGYQAAPMEGAYFAFVKLPISGTGCDFADRLLSDYGVGVIPGEAFVAEGCEIDLKGWFRISYAARSEILAEGLEGINKCLGK